MCAWQSHVSGGNPNFGARVAGSGGAQTGMFSSATAGCGYCIASHTASARKAGMTEEMFGELMAVVGMANETNRLANGYRVPIDAVFER
jgi:AhpD family alkylhydroperoxidase